MDGPFLIAYRYGLDNKGYLWSVMKILKVAHWILFLLSKLRSSIIINWLSRYGQGNRDLAPVLKSMEIMIEDASTMAAVAFKALFMLIGQLGMLHQMGKCNQYGQMNWKLLTDVILAGTLMKSCFFLISSKWWNKEYIWTIPEMVVKRYGSEFSSCPENKGSGDNIMAGDRTSRLMIFTKRCWKTELVMTVLVRTVLEYG